MPAAKQVVPILLAAGASRRFGGDKLTQLLPDGRPLALAAAQTLIRALGRVLVVVRSGDAPVSRCLSRQAGVHLVVCPRAERGMGYSIGCGVGAGSGSAGWLIALADMPYVRVETIGRLASRLIQGAAIVAPLYRGRRGQPVGFSRRFRMPLQSLRGEQGGRTLLEAHRSGLELIPCEDPGVLRDVDIPADLET
jgi:molybdenum cofactor cytidylyltransferase